MGRESRLMQVASNRPIWKSLGKAYMFSSGCCFDYLDGLMDGRLYLCSISDARPLTFQKEVIHLLTRNTLSLLIINIYFFMLVL